MRPSCYIIGTSWNDGAVAHHFKTLSKRLVERGNQVVVLVRGADRPMEDHDGNPAIYTWPSPRPTRLRDALFLYRLIQKYNPRCLIANFSTTNVMMLVGWLAGIPCRVAWYHTLSAQIELDGQMPPWKTRLLRIRKRLVYQVTTHLVANSSAASADAQRVFGVPKEKCRVAYNSLADPLSGAELPWSPRDECRLVCVGRLYPSKGQDTLIRAMSLLRKTRPEVYLEFVGDGPCREAYQQLARDLGVTDRCTFVGAVRPDEVLTRMGAAAVMVMPSRSEAFGLVSIESLSVGTPVVASRVGGIVEIIRDGIDGFVVPPDDPDALAEKLGVILSDRALRHWMSLNARERFLSEFELGRAVRAQVEWIERLVGSVSGVRG